MTARVIVTAVVSVNLDYFSAEESLFPFGGQTAIFEFLSTRMAENAASMGDRFWQLNLGMESFKISRLLDVNGHWFILSKGTGEGFDVFPDQ